MQPTNRAAKLRELHKEHVSNLEEQRHKAGEMEKLVLVLKAKAEKENALKLAQLEKEKFVKVKKLVRDFASYKKKEYAHELWLSIKHSSLLFPANQLAEAHRRLRWQKGASFEGKVLARMVILPKKEYLELEEMMSLSNSHGLFFRGLTFILEDALKRKGVLPSAAHEVSHLIDYFAGLKRKQKESEAMSEARALFASSLMSQKIRKKAVAQASREFASKGASLEYVKGINLGRDIFLLADLIREENGASEGENFIRQVAKYSELSEDLLNKLYHKAIGR